MISLLNRSHGGPGEDIRWISVFANGNKKSKKKINIGGNTRRSGATPDVV